NVFEALPVVRQLLGERDLDAQRGVDGAGVGRECAPEPTALFVSELPRQLLTQAIEKRGDARQVLLAVSRIVSGRRRLAALLARRDHGVETHEIDRVLDTGAELAVDPRREIERLGAAVMRVQEGHQSSIRVRPARSGTGVSPNVEKNGAGSHVL